MNQVKDFLYHIALAWELVEKEFTTFPSNPNSCPTVFGAKSALCLASLLNFSISANKRFNGCGFPVFIATLFWIGSFLTLHAQSELNFEHLSAEDGLSHNTVLTIYQDKEGFIWFGTGDGLNKFNGYTFQSYKADPKDPKNTLRFNYVYSIYEDSKGRFWVGSHGLHHFNKHTDTFTAYLPDSSQFSYLNIPLTIHEDEQGMLWFSAGGGLNRLDPETHQFTSYLSPELTPNFGLVEDINGTFWMGSSAGLYKFNPQSEVLSSFPLDLEVNPHPPIKALMIDSEDILWIGTEGEGLFRLDTKDTAHHAIVYNPNKKVNSSISNNGIMEDRNGLIWLATTEGLQQIDKENNQVNTYRADPSIPGSLSSNEVTAVFQDKTGTLWVGTDNGINKLISYPKPFHSYKIGNIGQTTKLEENKINSILTDTGGMVWLGTLKGLYQFNPLIKQTTHFSLSPHHSGDFLGFGKSSKIPSINAIKEDPAGGLWLGTSLGLYFLKQGTNQFSHYPCKIHIGFMALDPDGNLWIPGADAKGGNAVMAVFDTEQLKFNYTQYKVNDPSGLKDGYMKGLIASQSGDLWVAAGIWGIGFRDHTTGEFTHYLPNPESPGSMIENDVMCLFEDKGGMIWAGTRMGGLYRMDVKTGVLTNYTTHDGLPSNYIASITEDEQGSLWIGTNNGLSCFDPGKQNFRNFDKSDGLPDNEFRLASVFERNGKLYFGSDNGFVFFDPDSIHNNTIAPPVHITGIKVMEKKQNIPENKIVLPYDENFISFEFAALDYISPEKIQYSYMLENFNEDWILSGYRRYAAYTDLDPGQYVFRVKSSNGDGVWNENGASLQIIISPPWWLTPWAYVMYLLAGLILLVLFHYYSLKRERMKNDLKIKQIEADKLHELEGIRSRFFANISHEFRTPLTLILGPLEKLLDSRGPCENHSLYLMMERNARRLLHLINQLLDLSKLESGKLTLEFKPGNLIGFLQALAASFSSLAESRNIHFQTSFEQTDQIFYFDSDKIEKMVMNLLSNAFKFTPDGGKVAFIVKKKIYKPKDNTPYQIEIIVSDSGIGIENEEIEKIFDRFYQIGSSQTQERKGTGIGLALTRELVELHKGTIAVKSEVGKGTQFTICLPLNSSDNTGHPISQLPEINSEKNTVHIDQRQLFLEVPESNENFSLTENYDPGEKPLLLIVEDNSELSGYIASHFQSDFQVKEVSNGKLGFMEAFNTIPDIIISDVMMPEMDGVELCKKLKTSECTSHIPLILLTARAGEASKIEGFETGADDYLTKPFSGAELKARVKNLVEGRKRLRKSFSREIILRPAEVAITSADEKFLERLMAILEANYMDSDFNIDLCEREAGFSRTQFYRKMKALTNQAPGEFLRNFRLQKAMMLLKSGQGNVTDAAYAVGFNSLSYFTKCFKELYKKSPSQFHGTPTSSSYSS